MSNQIPPSLPSNTTTTNTRSVSSSSSFTKDEIQALSKVRRDIWMNSMKGLCVGMISGYTFYTILRFGHRYRYYKLSSIYRNRNASIVYTLLGGTIGSFTMSLTTGKNVIHLLYPMFDRIQNNTKQQQQNHSNVSSSSSNLSDYELSILQGKSTKTTNTIHEDDIPNHPNYNNLQEQLHRNRLYRRATISQSMEQHHSGLSDAHGGHWITNNDNNINEHDSETNTTTNSIDDDFVDGKFTK